MGVIMGDVQDCNKFHEKMAVIESRVESDHKSIVKTAEKADKIDVTLARVSEILSQLTRSHQETDERIKLLESSKVTEREIQILSNKFETMQDKVTALEMKPAKKWDSFTGYIMLAFTSGIIGYFVNTILR